MRQISIFLENYRSNVLPYSIYALHVLLGSLYLALFSQLSIPLHPIPITLQTFAIFTLALYQGKNKACASLILYLVEATIGLPVFAQLSSDPLWILDPSAGYLISFPFAAYLIGYFTESVSQLTFIRTLFSLFAGNAVIYLFGVTWLAYFVGMQQALTVGLYPFILMGAIKIFAAASLKMGTRQVEALSSY